MTTQNPRSFKPVEHENRFMWIVEQEKFRNNIKSLQRISEKWTTQREELDLLLAEMEWTRAETRSLRVLLDRTALRLGLEPLASRKNGRQ